MDKNRRRVLPLLPIIPLTMLRSPLNAAEPKQQLTLAAPGDVTVQTLHVSKGDVKSGDTLALLSSVQLDKYRSMLDLYTRMLAIEQRPFSDGRVQELIQLTQTEATSAQTAFTEIQKYAGLQADELHDGMSIDVGQQGTLLVEVEDRRTELATINNELAQLPKRIQDAKDRLALAAQQLTIQKTALDGLLALLTVKAPSNGLFVAAVGQGSFVKKGEAVGVLYL